MWNRRVHAVLAATGMILAVGHAATQVPSSRTQVVLLGTGNPGPTPDRSGPATAVVVNGQPYLIDFGAGVVRRAAAAQQKGIAALNPINIRYAFVTHLHSDHTVGYPDLIFTPWVIGRKVPLEICYAVTSEDPVLVREEAGRLAEMGVTWVTLPGAAL